MANLTKGQRDAEEHIKGIIYRAYKAGKCDLDGNSIKNEHGEFVKKPRNMTGARKIVVK